ncbi:MAG TPA: signal peptidase II [Gemmatimonadales bacterium]|nr:signal peptidase II [Gemmatimonadales bacterium]
MGNGAERRLYWGAGISILAIDIVTKYLAEQYLVRSSGRSLIGEWAQLRLVYNPGAAFGLDLGPLSRWIFMVIAILAVVLLYRYHRSAYPGDWFRQLALGLVSGGALGNLIDRIRSSQGVVDFLDLGVGVWRWPTFNVADMAVSCGAIALALSLWQEDARREAAAQDPAPPGGTPPAPATAARSEE